MSSDDIQISFARIRESSLLFLKADLALLAGISALDFFKNIDANNAVLIINEFSFVLGAILFLIATGVLIEMALTLTGFGVIGNVVKENNKNIKFELKLAKCIYGVQAFGHIGLLGILHGYLLSFVS